MVKNLQKDRDIYIKRNDELDKILMERKDKHEIDTQKCNPHRVQVYSLNEIWKNMMARLVELKVLRDPDDDSEADEGEIDSSDLEGDFDFIHEGRKRVGRLLKNKRHKF